MFQRRGLLEKTLLEVKDLSIRFRTQRGIALAIDKINFQVKEGETLGVVGESGSGKSVSSLAIMDLLPKENTMVDGQIYLNGVDLLRANARQRRNYRGNQIAMIFQEPMTSLNPLHTCGDQIMESLLVHKICDKKEAKERALELLSLTGIPAPEQRFAEYPHQMSGGMRQRIMIAMALACHPQLLIADEPTTALDVTIQAQILDLLKDLQAKFGMSVMLISHDLGVISEVCSSINVMYTGQIVERGEMDTVFHHPLHPYTIGLIKAIPKIGGDQGKLHPIDGMVPDITDLPKGCNFSPRCKHVMPCCIENEPPEVEAEGRMVRCFLYTDQIGGEK